MSPKSKKGQVRKMMYLESLIIFFLAVTPFLFKVYDYLPGPNHPNAHGPLSFLGISIGSNGFDSISTNMWFYTNKLIPLILLIFWFFTSKNWWYHIIIIPIATYAFQLFELIFSEDEIIDSENIWWLLPVCMVVIPFVYFIRVKLYDKHVHGIDLEAMDLELKYYKDKEREELRKAGIKVPEETYEEDMSTKTADKTLDQFLKQVKQAFTSLFNFFF